MQLPRRLVQQVTEIFLRILMSSPPKQCYRCGEPSPPQRSATGVESLVIVHTYILRACHFILQSMRMNLRTDQGGDLTLFQVLWARLLLFLSKLVLVLVLQPTFLVAHYKTPNFVAFFCRLKEQYKYTCFSHSLRNNIEAFPYTSHYNKRIKEKKNFSSVSFVALRHTKTTRENFLFCESGRL